MTHETGLKICSSPWEFSCAPRLRLARSRSRLLVSGAAVALLAGACTTQPERTSPPAGVLAPLPPIAARKPFQVASPHGTRQDDYYWLRDDTRESKEVLAYLDSENAYRDAVMAHTEALQQGLYEELVARLDPDESSVPVLEHGYWYYTRFVPGQDYPVYARRAGSMEAPEEVLLDGNAMARGLEFFQIGETDVSPDGRLLAYAEDTVGRRQFTLKVKDLASGALLADALPNVEADFVWASDNRTLLYIVKDPVTLLSERVYAHRIGSDPATDALVYEEADHSYYISLEKSSSEKYLFLELESTQQTEWRYAEASDPLHFETVLPREADHEYQVDHLGTDFILRTNWQAPNFRVVRAPIATRTDKHTWTDVVPHRADTFVESFEISTGYLALNERSGGLMKLRVKAWQGDKAWPGDKNYLIDASEPAYTMQLVATPGIESSLLRYTYTSLIAPESVYDYDMATGRKELKKTDKVLGGFDAANYTSEYLQAPARDGRQIPVSLAYRKGTRLDGQAPLFQYGYGAYGSSSDPAFVSEWVSLLDRGFVVAIAHVRGGQELGREWYESGRQLAKKNTFTDFIDVTEFLVRRGYGARDKVVAEGGSAGGLLMGAIANMAPEDFSVIVAHVPFVDAVTTMLDESIPLTTNEFDEWGNPMDKRFYDYLLSYSPYDNVQAQDYPALLVFTGLWDSQVQYYEPAKWVAKLRALKTDDHPLVFSVDMAAGHGGKSGRFQQYHDTAREYAFLLDQLGMVD